MTAFEAACAAAFEVAFEATFKAAFATAFAASFKAASEANLLDKQKRESFDTSTNYNNQRWQHNLHQQGKTTFLSWRHAP